MLNYFLIIFILSFILLNIYLDRYYKDKFKKENFPPNIIFDLKEDIELPDIEEGLEIPKNIYRCYKDLEGIDKFKSVFKLTEERMPGYKQIYYTDELMDTYIRENYSERIYKAYKNINPEYGAARADFFRYLLVYREGGIYMDIKTGPRKKIDNFFERYKGKLLVSKGDNGWVSYLPKEHLKNLIYFNDDWSYITNLWPSSEYQQFIIASNKGNPVLGKVIKQIVSNIEKGIIYKEIYTKGKYSVLSMTGPIMYSLVIQKYKKEYKDKIQFLKSDLDHKFNHSLKKDYKKYYKNNDYEKVKNKNLLL